MQLLVVGPGLVPTAWPLKSMLRSGASLSTVADAPSPASSIDPSPLLSTPSVRVRKELPVRCGVISEQFTAGQLEVGGTFVSGIRLKPVLFVPETLMSSMYQPSSRFAARPQPPKTSVHVPAPSCMDVL